MKPSREEVLKLWDLATLETGNGIDAMQYFAAAMYEAGAADNKKQIKQWEAKERDWTQTYERFKAIHHNLMDKYDAERAVSDRLLEAIRLAVWAMRAPLDDWKGEVERKALDASNVAIAEVEAMRKELKQSVAAVDRIRPQARVERTQ